MAERNNDKDGKNSPNSPLFAESDGTKTRRTQGLKIILFCLFAFVCIMFAVFLALTSVEQEREAQNQQQQQRAAVISDPSRIRNELLAGAAMLRDREEILPPAVTVISHDAPSAPQMIVMRPPTRRRDAARPPRELSQGEQERANRYRQLVEQSLASPSGVNFSNISSTTEGGGTRSGEGGSSGSATEKLMQMYMDGMKENGMAQGQAAVSKQQRKLDFLMQDGGERTPQGYSANTRKSPIAPMELKAGTVIPGLLLVGVNTDLPGTVIGQVSENVYDTATGRYLLIPQGTRIMGVYDSGISFGQKRVGIVWNRLIYPDGSSLNISGSPGTDMAGYAGIKGRVDNHYGQLLSAALFTALFTTAAEVIAPEDENSGYGADSSKSPKEILAETTGLSIANIGARMAEKALEIQPTIVIKPGSRFNVLVQEDIVFTSVWRAAGTKVSGF